MVDFHLRKDSNSPIHHQVDEMRRQLRHISKSLSDHGIDFDDMAHDAEKFMRTTRKSAKRAARHVTHDADILTRAAQRAPAGAGTVLAVAAIVGFGIGYLFHLAQND